MSLSLSPFPSIIMPLNTHTELLVYSEMEVCDIFHGYLQKFKQRVFNCKLPSGCILKHRKKSHLSFNIFYLVLYVQTQ